MEYSKIYRKGEKMKKEKKNKAKEEKYKLIDTKKLKKIEITIMTIVGIIFLVLLVLTLTSEIYLPATLISCSLFLFCICYYYIEDNQKKKLVYTLFTVGVLLIIIEVIYTIINIK